MKIEIFKKFILIALLNKDTNYFLENSKKD